MARHYRADFLVGPKVPRGSACGTRPGTVGMEEVGPLCRLWEVMHIKMYGEIRVPKDYFWGAGQ